MDRAVGGPQATLIYPKLSKRGVHALTFLKAGCGVFVLKNIAMKETSMSMTRKVVAVIGVSLIVGSASTSAFAQSKRTSAAATRDVSQLMRMMDKDMNGAVSKDEFMQFMSQTFDRLDINRSGQLERNELRRLTTRNWLPASPAPGQDINSVAPA